MEWETHVGKVNLRSAGHNEIDLQACVSRTVHVYYLTALQVPGDW